MNPDPLGQQHFGPDAYGPEDVLYGIDGGHERIYDGIVIWVLRDGRRINRFRGEDSRRERMTDELLESMS